VDVGGVGYEVRVPLSTYLTLPGEGEPVRLRIHTHVREESLQLFGFLTEAHKWKNLQIRFREFMPVGVRPLLIPVT